MQYRRPAIIIGVLLLISIVCLLSLSWFYNNGRIEILMPEGEKTVTIQHGEVSETFTTNEIEYSKIMPSNSYTITVAQEAESKSYVANQKIGRFLETSTITAALKSEAGRSFVGENPRSCSEFLGEILITYICNGALKSMSLHVPATDSTPTYVKSLQTVLDAKRDREIDPLDVGVVEGLVNNGNELLVLTYKFESGIGFHNLYRVNVVNNSFELSFVDRIETLPEKSVFRTETKNNTLRLYSEDNQYVYSGPSFDKLEKVNVDIEPKEGLEVRFIGVDFAQTLLGYGEFSEDAETISDETQKSVIVLKNESSNIERKYDYGLLKLQFCGDKVCALDNSDNLHIYSLELEELAVFENVLDFKLSGEEVLFATATNITNINLSDLTGYNSVSFGQYKFSVLSINNKGILVALNSGSRSYALAINTSGAVYPDKQVEALLNEKEAYINTVSIFGNRIFISPELGEPEYIPESQVFDYSDSTKLAAKNNIENYLNQIGLDRSAFKVKINNL